MEEEKVVSLKFYGSMIEAEIEMDVLKNNGIECMLNDGTMVGLFPIFDDITSPLIRGKNCVA